MNRTRPALILLVAGILLVGCRGPKLMPTPVVFAGTGIDPIAAPIEEGTSTRVLFATDRTPRDHPPNPASTYSNDRDFGLRVGAITVDMAPHLTGDELRACSLESKRTSNPTPRFVEVEEFGPLWTDIPNLQGIDVEHPEAATRFIDDLHRQFEATGTDEIFIFVHGFNTKFADNAVIAAELHHYLGSRGAFITYAWPSKGSLFAYSKDKASSAYSIRYFRLFLAFLAERTNVSKIHILAHSAGAPVAVGAIRELCLMRFEDEPEAVRERYRLASLMLVAPDIDLGIFQNAAHDEIVGVPEHMAIYISTKDRALDMSSWIFGFARLGEPLTELRPKDVEFLENHPAVELIDVAAAEKNHGSWLGHSYFHDDPWVSSDLLMLMHHRKSAEERGLVRLDGKPIWSFPKDYPERATEAARELYGTK